MSRKGYIYSTSTNNGDEITPEWFNYMKEIYKDNTRATVAQTPQIQNTIYNAPPIRININGQDVPFSHAPVLNEGIVYASYEDIAQAYGAVVTKDEYDCAILSKNGVNLKFSLNTRAGTVLYTKAPNYEIQSTFRGKPYWSGGAFYVPIYDIIKGLNLYSEIFWKPEQWCVFITG